MPLYGDCWKKALEDLDKGCKALTDDMQSRMALSFANCFLGMSGQSTYPCPQHRLVADCLRSVDTKAFSAFSNFFTHTHNMCQFLQSQVWHQKTEETIGTLSQSSAKVAKSMENWSEMQETILEKQAVTLEYQKQTEENIGTLSQSSAKVARSIENYSEMQETILARQAATLEYQKQIAADGTALNRALEASRESAKQLMDEFRTSTDEQRALILTIFDRVAKLQSMVVSEVSWIYSVLFYAGTLILVHVMTATKRTADARFPLLMLFTLNGVVERLICNFSLGANDPGLFVEHLYEEESVPEVINFRIWVCRKLSLTAAAVFLAYSVWAYKDYNILNNNILMDIQAQNTELRTALQFLQLNKGGADVADHSNRSLTPAVNGDVVSSSGSMLIMSDDEEDCSDTDSDITTVSYSSVMTDRTWMLPIEHEGPDLSDRDDFSDDSDVDDDLLDEHISANNSGINGSIAGMKIMSPPVTPPFVENVTSSADALTPKKKGRARKKSGTPTPSSSSGGGSRGVTPLKSVHNVSYNLRNRSVLNKTNTAFDNESVGDFIKAIDNAARNSSINRRALTRELKNLQKS